jgi:ABC-type dipeptide/oligopeptide/nickel transport system permease component/ABC-type antimicrobial peptide transport system permease subunit
VRQVSGLVLVILGIVTIIFSIPYLAPGGPERALIGWPYTAERAAALRLHYGFDRPLLEQYGLWLRNWYDGEWGRSKFTGRPVLREVTFTLPLTLKLLAEAVALAVFIGALVALAASYPWHRFSDERGRGLGVVAAGFPDFYFGILMKFFFVWHLEWFPIGGFAFFSERPWLAYRQLLLPALSVGILYGIIIGPRVAARLAARREAHEEGFYDAAHGHEHRLWRLFGRALGHSFMVLFQHGPLVLGSIILAERIFAIPGFGDFGIEAFVRRDYPKIQAFLLIIVGGYAVLRTMANGIEASWGRRLRGYAAPPLYDSQTKSSAGLGALCTQDSFFLGVVLVSAIAATALFASYIAPFLPDEVHMRDRLQPPTTQYWMGSDLLGRDMLSRVIFGGRYSLLIVASGATAALVLGFLLGGVPRLARGLGVALMSPLVALLEVFPGLILGLLMMTLLGQGLVQEIVALTAALTPSIAATFLRGEARGASGFPVPVGLIATVWLQGFSVAIIIEASLNFLDIGLLPLIPSWGGDLKANLPYLHVNPAIVLFPGIAVMVSALGFSLMAEAVRKHAMGHQPG